MFLCVFFQISNNILELVDTEYTELELVGNESIGKIQLAS